MPLTSLWKIVVKLHWLEPFFYLIFVWIMCCGCWSFFHVLFSWLCHGWWKITFTSEYTIWAFTIVFLVTMEGFGGIHVSSTFIRSWGRKLHVWLLPRTSKIHEVPVIHVLIPRYLHVSMFSARFNFVKKFKSWSVYLALIRNRSFRGWNTSLLCGDTNNGSQEYSFMDAGQVRSGQYEVSAWLF